MDTPEIDLQDLLRKLENPYARYFYLPGEVIELPLLRSRPSSETLPKADCKESRKDEN
jgi:hypothetical protein